MGRILDLACGTGEFSTFFKEEDYVGIDIFREYVHYAERIHRRIFLLMDATNLGFKNEIFD